MCRHFFGNIEFLIQKVLRIKIVNKKKKIRFYFGKIIFPQGQSFLRLPEQKTVEKDQLIRPETPHHKFLRKKDLNNFSLSKPTNFLKQILHFEKKLSVIYLFTYFFERYVSVFK